MILLVAIIIILLVLTVQVFNIIGYVNITNFAFKSTKIDDNTRTIALTDAQMNFIKLSVILQIISILFVFISFINGDQKTKSFLPFQVVFYIVYAIGLVFITQFAFTSKDKGYNRSIKLDNTKMVFVKITAVMQWISIGFLILAIIGALLGYTLLYSRV